MTIKDIIKLLPADVETYRRRLKTLEEDGFNKDFMKVFYRVYEVISALSKIMIHPKDFCDVCWTSSWAPCPKDYPNAQQVKGKDEYVICQMCEADRRIMELTKIPKPEGKGLLQQKYVARCKELEAKVSEYRMALETLLELAMSCKRAGLKDMKIDGVIDIVTKGE